MQSTRSPCTGSSLNNSKKEKEESAMDSWQFNVKLESLIANNSLSLLFCERELYAHVFNGYFVCLLPLGFFFIQMLQDCETLFLNKTKENLLRWGKIIIRKVLRRRKIEEGYVKRPNENIYEMYKERPIDEIKKQEECSSWIIYRG